MCYLFIFLYRNSYFITFDLELEKFGDDIQVLKDPVIFREFVGWAEDWEEEVKKKNCPVVEAHFITNHKHLSFLFEDNNKVYTIFEGNVVYHQVKTGGWVFIGECSEEGIEDEGFCPFLVVTLIRNNP